MLFTDIALLRLKDYQMTYILSKGNRSVTLNPLFSKISFSFFLFCDGSVRVRVRIYPPHPLVYCKRQLNSVVLQMRVEKPRSHVTAGVAQ
jgi:hypothetical protein